MAVEFEKNNKDRLPYLHYLELFGQKDPLEIAERCHLPYDPATQDFTVVLMGRTYALHYPDGEVTHAAGDGFWALELMNAKILLLRHVVDGAFTPASGKFLSYRDMPWGEVYYRNFQGRCLDRFAFTFAKRPQALVAAMEKLGAKRIQDGDFGYEMEFMPGLFLRFTLWLADDEFPPAGQILFSDNFALAFSAEDMAYVGDVSIGALTKI